jgi:cytochrome c-type biogenesis protein CcmE
MTPRCRRFAIIVATLAGAACASALVAHALRRNLVFFYSPSQLAARETPAARSFGLGGLVERGSVRRDGRGLRFVVTDTVRKVAVRYEGVPPRLFGEGRGVVVQGRVGRDGVFMARELYAKHEEGYAPPAPGEALERARAGQYPVALLAEDESVSVQPSAEAASSAQAAPIRPGSEAMITQVGMRSR